MGIKSLQSYILQSNSIAQHCEYKEEIEKWRLGHGCKPTIIVDLKEFSNAILCVCNNTFRKGGNFDKYIKVATRFLAELKKMNADLVFFHKEKFYDDSDRTMKKFPKLTHDIEYDKIQRGNQRHINNMIKVAKKHGQLIVLTKCYKNSIAKYANEHADKVLAIVSNDTDYLVYDVKCQYWSLADLPNTHGYIQMHGRRFDRSTLLVETGMSNEHIRLLAILSDTLDNWFKFPLGTCDRMPHKVRFRHALKYATEQCLNAENSFDWKKIAMDLFGKDKTDEHVAQFEMRYKKFDPNNQPEDKGNDAYKQAGTTFVEVLECFKINDILSYHGCIDCDRKVYVLRDLWWLNKSEASVEFAEAVISVLAKFPGIFYKDVDEERRPTSWKLLHPLICSDGEIQMRDIDFPPDSKITLNKLIVDEKNRAYDEERWNLLQWTLGFEAGFLSNIRKTPSAGNTRIVAFALHFLLKNNLIRTEIAKSILHTEINAKSQATPNLRQHGVVNRWQRRPPQQNNPTRKLPNLVQDQVQDAHKYTIVFWLVCRALELCGLRNEADLITFNAFNFYEAMENQNANGQKSVVEDILFAA